MNKKSQARTVPGISQQWENGDLGQDEAFVKVSAQSSEQSINDALELELISIRLPKGVLEDLKMLAEQEGIGYQPLIRHILTRFTGTEKSGFCVVP